MGTNQPAIFIPLPLMGRGRGGVMDGVERGAGITPSQPTTIEREGLFGERAS
jgi:hypothetical protein